MTGLFPTILKMIIDNVCSNTCNSYNKSTIFYDRTYSGDPSIKKNENGVRRTIGESAHLNFPIQGRMTMESFQGFPFIGIIPFQGTAFIVYHNSVVSVGMAGIFKAVFQAWSVILVSCLLAWLCGCVYWFTVSSIVPIVLVILFCYCRFLECLQFYFILIEINFKNSNCYYRLFFLM